METRASKRKKISIEAARELKERTQDRISDLPNGILHHILSFLPIQLIAQTSVLSKRWRFLWYSYPHLDFSTVDSLIRKKRVDLHKPHTTKRLHDLEIKAMEFITTLLARRHEDSNIKVFRLSSYVSFYFLHDCIRRLVKHNVEHLELDVFLRDRFDLPRCLFGCDSLRVLKLNPQNPNPELENLKLSFISFPTCHAMASTGLRSLHTLCLACIRFMDSPSAVANLFSASCFPLLKNLHLEDCIGMDHLTISCPKLENLKLIDLELYGLDVSSTRVEVLEVNGCFHDRSNESWVKIFAPQLKTFYWEYNAITDRCIMEDFTSLEAATIYFLTHRLSAAKLPSAATLFSVLSFGRCLNVGSCVVELLSNIDFAGGLPSSFNHLTSLELNTGLNKREIPGIACLIRSSPMLHTLDILIHNNYRTGRNIWDRDLLDNSGFTEEQYWESQSESFKSFQNHLKIGKINVCGSTIHDSVVDLVKFLLKHGRVLEEMILSSHNTNATDPSLWQQTIGSQIMEFPRASANVKISLL